MNTKRPGQYAGLHSRTVKPYLTYDCINHTGGIVIIRKVVVVLLVVLTLCPAVFAEDIALPEPEKSHSPQP